MKYKTPKDSSHINKIILDFSSNVIIQFLLYDMWIDVGNLEAR